MRRESVICLGEGSNIICALQQLLADNLSPLLCSLRAVIKPNQGTAKRSLGRSQFYLSTNTQTQ